MVMFRVASTKLILALIFLLSFTIRIFPFVKYEAILHEFDPYFNYRCAEYMVEHGIQAFWSYFDSGSWYPFGRMVGQTVYPGLMLTAYLAHWTLNYIGLNVSIKHVCIFLAPCVSMATALSTYLLSMEICQNVESALFSALFISSMPSLISRSTTGSFDNEAIAIFLLVMSFYTWLRATRIFSMMSVFIASVFTCIMATSWGGYIFVLNAIACFVIACILLDVSPEGICITYIRYHVITTILCYQVPVIGGKVFSSMEHKTTHCVFLLVTLYLIASYIRKTGKLRLCLCTLIPTVISLPFLGLKFPKIHMNWSGRVLPLLYLGLSHRNDPLVASISEHRTMKWTDLVLDFWITLLFNHIGFYVCFRDRIKPGYLFLAIYGVLSSYFAAVMIRLGLIFAPAAAVLSGIGVSYILNKSLSKGGVRAIITNSVVFLLLASYVIHCTWVACNIYSNSNVLMSWRDPNGSKIVADDFRNAYSWIRQNTHKDSVIMAWWDYGYQLRQMGNRIILTDNNTSNVSQISKTAMIFASPESTAYKMLRKLNVDYVMVVFGGIAKYSNDDISKFPWMVRIASRDFHQIHQNKFFSRKNWLPSGEYSNIHWEECLLFKLCYYKVASVVDTDKVRKIPITKNEIRLTHFTEVFKTEGWLVRIYKVNK